MIAPKTRLPTVLVAVVVTLAVACVPFDPPPSTTTTTTNVPGVVTDVAVVDSIEGFSKPWDIGFTPGGTALVTERSGTLSAVMGGARQAVGTIEGVVAKGEGGLMGIAVAPDFAVNRQVYLCLAHGSGATVTDVRVVRVQISPGYDSVSAPIDVLAGIPAGAGNRHLGCRLEIGPDNMLWVTTGDAAVGANPQDPTSLAGKVLRMTLAGNPAPGNPGGAWNPYVYTIGHRNPQGLAFRPSDGAAFSVEHGPGCDDEVNLLVAGNNYGWAPTGGAGGYGEGVPMTFAGATPAVWSSGCPTIAPSGATFVSGAQWGQWEDQLAMTVLKGTELRFVRLDDSTLVGTDVRLEDQGRLRTVQMGPDGRLWVAQDSSPGSILVLDPATA